MNLTSDQYRIYFEARLQGQKFSATGNWMVRCPFPSHGDRTPSLSLNVGKGVWSCKAGCGEGGIVDFEMKYSNCDKATAWANIADICGAQQRSIFSNKPEAVYKYTDEDGKLLFEKLRFPGKKFVQRAADGTYKLDGVRKVLYRLPEVVRASEVIITEGEKDTDRVSALKLNVAVTTNFDGAGKWRAEYAPYFTGKRVVILPDNDAQGKIHAQQVAVSISPYAWDLRIVELPGLEEHGDVSDYLESHNADDLLQVIRKAPQWKPETKKLILGIDSVEFLEASSPEIDWLVEGLIQRKANGFICADPKVGKSWAAADLALSLALGLPWLGFNVPKAEKVWLITREDNPALTRWRMDRLLVGKNINRDDLRGRLYVNTREQSPNFKIDVDELLTPMIAEMKAVRPELVILDVFNVLHSADENDNTEMRAVLDRVTQLQTEVECSVGLVHHFCKSGEGGLTQRLRGASAIAGFAEWLIGLERVDEHVRKMQFDIKVAESPDPIHFRITGEPRENWQRLERTDSPLKRVRVSDLLETKAG